MTPKLNLKGWGLVDAEVLWKEGHILKIAFTHSMEKRSEIFHVKEILNSDEIFIDKKLVIRSHATLERK